MIRGRSRGEGAPQRVRSFGTIAQHKVLFEFMEDLDVLQPPERPQR